MKAMLRSIALPLLLLAGAVRADEAPPAANFFTEGGGVVAHYHFSGPMSPHTDVWLRKDGHVLSGRQANPNLPDLDADSFPQAEPADGGAPPERAERPSYRWTEATTDPALVSKALKLAAACDLCKRRSTEGFSVGGAWLLGAVVGKKMCSLRRRARLDIEPPVRKFKDAVHKAIEGAKGSVLRSGTGQPPWPIAAELTGP